MIQHIQKHWQVWPQPYAQPSTRKYGRFDKVIGLVPQHACLFKLFYYQCDLVAQSELTQCVENEVAQLVEWPAPQIHQWATKVGDQWQVAVWFWDSAALTFAQPVTHIVPAMAYYLACADAQSGILIYQEPALVDPTPKHGATSDDSHRTVGEASPLAWALTWQDYKHIEQLYPLSSPLYQRQLTHKLQNTDAAIYCTHADNPWVTSERCHAFNLKPKASVLAQGKCSNQVDFDNPWLYWRKMAVILGIMLAYFAADATVLSYQQTQLDTAIDQLQAQTAPIQQQRAKASQQQKVIRAYNAARLRQQRPAILIEAMTQSLPNDVIIDRLSYQNNTMVLQGTIENSLDVLSAITAIEGVANAKLLGDVTPVDDNRQEFRAEVTLEAIQ